MLIAPALDMPSRLRRICAIEVIRNHNLANKKPMKKSIYTLSTLLIAAIVFVAIGPASAANLSDTDKQFLASYEKVHNALASDDLTAAKSAARELGEDGSAVANAGSLKDARAGFEKLSARAKSLAAGQSGYYTLHCPMLNKEWVQTSTRVANPYGGKGMVGCGEIQK